MACALELNYSILFRVRGRSKRQPESLIENAILRYLNMQGIYCWKNKTQGTYDPVKKIYRANTVKKGVADILGILPNGRFLAIEVKTKKGQLTVHQKDFLRQVSKNGGLAFVARSVDDCMFRMNEFFKITTGSYD